MPLQRACKMMSLGRCFFGKNPTAVQQSWSPLPESRPLRSGLASRNTDFSMPNTGLLFSARRDRRRRIGKIRQVDQRSLKLSILNTCSSFSDDLISSEIRFPEDRCGLMFLIGDFALESVRQQFVRGGGSFSIGSLQITNDASAGARRQKGIHRACPRVGRSHHGLC